MTPTIQALCALSYLSPEDRECWYDKRVLGIGERQQGRRDGTSNFGVYYRVNRADRQLRCITMRGHAQGLIR